MNYLDRYGKSVGPVYLYTEVSNGLSDYRSRIYSSYQSDEADKTLDLLNEYFQKNPNSMTNMCLKANTLARLGRMEEAGMILQYSLSIAKHRYQKMRVHYAFANYLSLAGNYESAMSYLKYAIQCGFDNMDHIMEDEDLAGLRESKHFGVWKSGLSRAKASAK
ncbi:MAG: hypothetical protein WBB45_09255 [Cyclobacteriaceae bacterium]